MLNFGGQNGSKHKKWVSMSKEVENDTVISFLPVQQRNGLMLSLL